MGEKGHLLSDRDYARVEELLRWFDRNRSSLKIPQRRRTISTVGNGSVQYAIVTEVPAYNDPTRNKFVVQKASKNGDDEWEGDGTDIDIERAFGYEGVADFEGTNDAYDIRHWHPWPAVNSTIQIVEKWDAILGDKRWYMVGNHTPAEYAGNETVSSLRVDDETLLPQAVWA